MTDKNLTWKISISPTDFIVDTKSKVLPNKTLSMTQVLVVTFKQTDFYHNFHLKVEEKSLGDGRRAEGRGGGVELG